MTDKLKTRLYVTQPLYEDASLAASAAQAAFLRQTLRCRGGECVALFNGKDGEWIAQLQVEGKRDVMLAVKTRRAEQYATPDIWLVFAPVKNEKIDFLARRAVELGVSALIPVMTQRTIVTRVNEERLHANAIEAAEQCGRMDVPHIHEPQKLVTVLSEWPKDRVLIHCDEAGDAPSVRALMPVLKEGAYGVLIGPEGGFSDEERQWIRGLPYARAVHMGPRILRAETAALTALAHMQAWVGDGDKRPHFEAMETA